MLLFLFVRDFLVSNPDFCNMVHLAPLTPAWPANLFGGGANINRKNARNHIQSRSYNVCAIYYHECTYVWRLRNALALGACAWQPSKQRTSCTNKKVYGKCDPFVQTELLQQNNIGTVLILII